MLSQNEDYLFYHIIAIKPMSVIMKDIQIKQHQKNYYRHNPFSDYGYIPPVSLKNRKQPSYASQMPQGVQYFSNCSKKHYPERASMNTIADQNLLSYPQKYPLQHTLANDKQFLRNLCTLDIEGANANSKKSLGVRNRIKAQEQLMRRNAPIITPLIFNGNSQELVKRRLAEDQLQRVNSRQYKSLDSRERNYHSEKNLRVGVEYYNKNPYVQKKDFAMQFQVEDILSKKLTNKGFNKKQKQNPESPDYHSQQLQKLFETENKALEDELIERFGKGSNSSTFRLINPTNLSYDGSIVRKSGVLLGMAKNMLLG